MTQPSDVSRMVYTCVALTIAIAALAPPLSAQRPPGGATAAPAPEVVLTLNDAIQRGLDYNLATMGLTTAVGQARAMERTARSALMPDISGEFSALEQRLNLAAMGVKIEVPVPGFTAAETAGPFNVLDLRARVTQTLISSTSRNSYRAAREAVRASELSLEDARDLIVLSVGTAYLDALAAQARAAATRAQVDTAQSIHDRAVMQRNAGLATPIDLNRAQVQTLTAQQRLTSMQADFAKKKISLARMIGMPPTDQFDLATQGVPFSAAPEVAVADALRRALERPEVRAAEAKVRAAEFTLAAARGGRLPTVLVSADAGTNRASESSLHSTYTVAGVVRVPIWTGGRTDAQIQQAVAALTQRQTELNDLRMQIEADVRKAFVDLAATASQVNVARANLQLTRETLTLTRQRFDAGVSDNVSVVQSQESQASAEFDDINSVFAHNLAKLGLARAVGRASEDLAQYLKLP